MVYNNVQEIININIAIDSEEIKNAGIRISTYQYGNKLLSCS